jgi:hypothetical protein
MEKKTKKDYVITYRDVDPYTGHIDAEGETCRTTTHSGAERIIEALTEFNLKSKQGRPNREYSILVESRQEPKNDHDHWWTW